MGHSRVLSRAEAEAFRLLHTSVQNVVLVPVVLNGQDRFAITLVQKTGEQFTSSILGYLAVSTDELKTVDGQLVAPVKPDEVAAYGPKKYLH